MTRTAKACKRLMRALRDLEPEQGRIARRNARAKVAAAQRLLRRAIEDEFPTIYREHPKAPPLCANCSHPHFGQNPCPICAAESVLRPPCTFRRRAAGSRLTDSQRVTIQKSKLRRRGFQKLAGSIPLPIVAAAQVKTIVTRDGETWVPEWVNEMPPTVSGRDLREAKISIPKRKALIAAAAMSTRFHQRVVAP